MTQVKRSHFFFVFLEPEKLVDVSALLRGEVSLSSEDRIKVASPLTASEHTISELELRVVMGVSEVWTPVDEVLRRFEVDQATIDHLCQKGLLLSNRADPHLAALRRNHDSLTANRWNRYAALYHFVTQSDGSGGSSVLNDMSALEDYARGSRGRFDEVIEAQGKPPPHFHRVPDADEVVPLSEPRMEGSLFEVLRRRKTTRHFDEEEPLNPLDLSTILFHVWGCHGYQSLSSNGELVALKKTSPSAGALHPVEVYPVVRNVEGVVPGVYHYQAGEHALYRLERIDERSAGRFARGLTHNQAFVESAPVLFLMTARFHRNFWKYHQIARSYSVVLMDAAHLSQTFYLVCTDLGLGAFFTGAVNYAAVVDELRLDGFNEGPIGLCGCGAAADRSTGLDFSPEPFVPGQSKLTWR